jgi:histidine triad (HIT) family protein
VSLDPACVFCAIVSGSAPAERVYEDDLTLAFMDMYPATDGHALVVPKTHFADVFALEPPYEEAIWHATVLVARAAREAFSPPGLTIRQANGREGDQHVFHVHLHVIPRYGAGERADRGRLSDNAERLRAVLSGG